MVASFFVGTSIDYTGNLRPAYRASTHRAGLDGDVECAVGEVLATQRVGCGGDGLHLGMGRHVAKGLRQIVRAGDNTVLAYDDGANGDFAGFKGCPCFVERHLHVALVFFL